MMKINLIVSEGQTGMLTEEKGRGRNIGLVSVLQNFSWKMEKKRKKKNPTSTKFKGIRRKYREKKKPTTNKEIDNRTPRK